MRYFVNRFPAVAGDVNVSEAVWLPKIRALLSNILANQVKKGCFSFRNSSLFFLPRETYCIMEARFFRFWDFTVCLLFSSYSIHVQCPLSKSNPRMVTHPSANPVPSCLTSVFFRELVFPTWYSVAIQDFCSMLEQYKNLLRHP